MEGPDPEDDHRYQPATIASGPLSLNYVMTPAGDVHRLTDSAGTHTFTYDFLDKLAGSPGWVNYTYDNNGNRTAETVAGVSATYSYYGLNDQTQQRQVATGTSQALQQNFSYDSQGSVSFVQTYGSSGVAGQGNACLVRDALERLVTVASLSSGYASSPTFCGTESAYQSVIARLKYDARNRRIARWVAAANTWVYTISDSSGQPLSELGLVNGNWIPLRDYVWLDGKPLVQIEYPGPAGSPQGYGYYIHADALGAPRVLTNQSGQVVWAAAMRSYGDLVEATAPDSLSGRTVVTNLRLPGQYDERLLNSIGLQGPYYNWSRWYLPGVGRYLELDPVAMAGRFNGGHGPDWYNYANGNPARFTDFDGRAGGPFVPEPQGGPPFPVPGGGPGVTWQWNPDPGNGRGGSYGPSVPLPGQGQPSTSWDPIGRGHWDLDDGEGNASWWDRWGNRIDGNQHDPKPTPGWLTRIPLILFLDPCLISPSSFDFCQRKRLCDGGA